MKGVIEIDIVILDYSACFSEACDFLKGVWNDLKTLQELISEVKTRWNPAFYTNLI